MRSFGLVKKFGYQPHRVLTQEKPHETVMNFYFLARSCTQAPLNSLPAHRPCRREKCACLGTFKGHRRGTRPAKHRPKFPVFRGFFILPQRHLPERDFPVQVNPTQINTK